MGREQVVQIYSRTTGFTQANNAAYTEVQFSCPAEGRIRRVRAEFAAGSVGTQIALQVREQTGGLHWATGDPGLRANSDQHRQSGRCL